jgi:hypothetical protein
MNSTEFRESVKHQTPPEDLPAPLGALWWDAKGDWTQAHSMVDALETKEGMAVHAYLHRKEAHCGTPTTGTRVPAALSIVPNSTMSGRLSSLACYRVTEAGDKAAWRFRGRLFSCEETKCI